MGLMDSLSNPYMGTMGMGLLAASQPQPPGVNRYSYLMDAMQNAQQAQMQQELFKMKKEEYESEKKQRMAQQSALSELVGGPDPKTGISWETGRQLPDPGQQMASDQSAAFRAFPQQMGSALAGSMFPKPDSPTSTVQNAIAMGLRPGTPEFNAYVRDATVRKGNQTNVNVTNTPKQVPGYELVQEKKPDGSTSWKMKPIEGGPEDPTMRENAKREAALREGAITLDAINQTERLAKETDYGFLPTTGFVGNFTKIIGGTKARDLDASLNTIRAQIGFSKLNQMREASPTGGALGQVTEREHVLLQAVYGSLEQSMSQEQFLYNLQRVKAVYNGIVNGVRDENGNLIDFNKDPEKWANAATGVSLDVLAGDKFAKVRGGTDFDGMSNSQFIDTLTDDNYEAWLKEARRRGLAE